MTRPAKRPNGGDNAAAERRRRRYAIVTRGVTCCYAGCMRPPVRMGKPYCTEHSTNGSLNDRRNFDESGNS